MLLVAVVEIKYIPFCVYDSFFTDSKLPYNLFVFNILQ